MYVHVRIHICSCTYTCTFMYICIIRVHNYAYPTHEVVHIQPLSVYIKIVFDIDVKF